MSFKLRPILFAMVALFSTNFMTSCVKDKFDTPPTNGEDPALTVTTTISELKQLFEGEPVEITDDLIIAGVVSADDESGNFYKNLIIEDASGGILVRIDRADAYVNFPVGRRIFIKCKGLWLGDYNNLIQLGGSFAPDPLNPGVNGIADVLIDQYLFAGQYNLPVVPTVAKITDLNNSFQSKLIKLENVEFDGASKGQTFADAINLESKNLTVTDCDGNEIIVRTSGYCNFAADLSSEKNGTLVGVYSVFGSTAQLLIRDIDDVQMEGARCDGGTGIVTSIDISAVRALFTGTTVAAPVDKKITGTVISDKTTQSVETRNLIIQDGTGGIVIRFSANHNFVVGDVVDIIITGGSIAENAATLQILNLSASAVTKTGTTTPSVRTATIAEINTNFEAWESTLVKINSATLSGNSGKFNGNVTCTDATGNIILYTRSASTFSANSYPTGTKNITGILTPFNSTKEIVIRSVADIE